MLNRFSPVLCLALCLPIQAAAAPSDSIQENRRLLARRNCESRVIGLGNLLDKVPPTELFDAAWDCANDSRTDSDTQREARQILKRIVGRRDRVMVPQILEALKDPGARDGSDLVSAITEKDPPVKEAVPVVVGLLDSGNEPTRKSAVSGLGRMGSAAVSAAPQLAGVLQSDRDPEIRVAAAEALGRIGPKCAKAAVPALAAAARDDKWPKVRSTSLTALGEMGPAAKEAIPVLRAALKDPDGWISQAATLALFRVEPDAKDEVVAIADAARPVQKGILWEDLSELAKVLPGRFPEVYELVVYDKSAMVKVPCKDTESGRCEFSYEGGAVTGPKEESGDCEKRIQLAKVDFNVVPSLAKQAPGLLGSPSGKVELVMLSPGVFCKSHGWIVHVKDAGMVQFKLNGKVDKVQKF
jgi:hypothetical protein